MNLRFVNSTSRPIGHWDYSCNKSKRPSLSIMNVIGSGGVNGKVLYPLTEEEQLLLHKSADALKAIIAELKF